MLRRTSLLRTLDDISLVLDEQGNDALTLAGKTIRLNPRELAALEVFSLRRSLASGVRSLSRLIANEGPDDALRTVVDLYERGILVDSPAPAARRPSARGMFGSPLAGLADVRAGDIVVYGMPYERGVTGRRGTSAGPEYFRRASATAFDYPKGDRPGGWWHPTCKRRVLDGVSIRDIGDVECSDSTRNGVAFDRLYQVQRRILELGAFPLLVGGDHSISLPAINAVAERHPDLGVIHFDAHSDLGPERDMGDWRQTMSHGNFMTWVVGNERVSKILQLGVRHLVPRPGPIDAKIEIHHGLDWRGRLGEILDSLPSARPYYLTFDVDCLDPSVVGQTGTPIPGGLSYHHAVEALRMIAGRLELVGMDIVELCDGPTLLEGTLVAYLAFEVLAHRDLRLRELAIARDPVRVW